jgi:hypothetical protein
VAHHARLEWFLRHLEGNRNPSAADLRLKNALVESFHRIKTALDTGKDPGEEDALRVLASKGGGPGGGGGLLPQALRELLDKLKKGGKAEEPAAGPSKEGKKPIEEI